MASKITFSRESLNKYKAICEIAEGNGDSIFIWKNQVNKVVDAKQLIQKLEASPNLSITIKL